MIIFRILSMFFVFFCRWSVGALQSSFGDLPLPLLVLCSKTGNSNTTCSIQSVSQTCPKEDTSPLTVVFCIVLIIQVNLMRNLARHFVEIFGLNIFFFSEEVATLLGCKLIGAGVHLALG